MTKHNENSSHEKKMENFTASFLLSEFRADIRHIENNIDQKFDVIGDKFSAINTRLDSNFKWTLGIMFVMTFSILGIMFAKF